MKNWNRLKVVQSVKWFFNDEQPKINKITNLS
mgnify:FL=1